jgi:vacuolar-type H+-ATPase subunit C/Vma6
MSNALAAYGAVCAKAHGMYGKRLTGEDWQRLKSASEPEQIAEILRRTPGWGPIPEGADPDSLKAALQDRVHQETEHLERFVQTKDDKKALGLLLRMKAHALAMDAEDYRKAWDYLLKDYKGLSALALEKLLGTEADMLNVTYLLRLRGFPGLKPRAEQYLIPVRHELSPRLAKAMLAAPDDRAALEALRGTRMYETFAAGTASPEEHYRAAMEKFCRKLMEEGTPSLAVPAAYLMLKELERQRLDRLIEAVNRGLDPKAID